MLMHALCAAIAPAFVSAAAYLWALPEPTLAIPAIDGWSPKPTAPPRVAGFELFPRGEGDTVCGFIAGLSTASSVTCPPGKSSICATNTYYGVHGCCDPGNIANCDIPTTCVPSSMMSVSCSDDKCSSNALVKKCTATDAPECYVWNFVYSTARTTTMTEWGCAAKHGTAIVERSWSGSSTSKSSSSTRTTSSTTSSSTEPSPTTLAQSQPPSKPNNTAAIVGGTVGGLVVVGAVASFIIYLLYRDRRLKREAAAHQSFVSGTTTNNNNNSAGVTEFNPHGFIPAGAWETDDNKGWGGSPTTVHVMGSPVMAETGNHGNGHGQATLFGVAEAHGQAVHEAPA